MVSIARLYSIVEEDRERMMDYFEKVEKTHLYSSEHDRIWSPEMVFRHNLMNCYWMLDKLPGDPIKPSKLALNLGEVPEDQATLEEIREAFDKISPILRERFSILTPEQEEQSVDTWRGKMLVRVFLIRLINHEHRHLGQIMWLFKRSTGWTDKEIYAN